MKVAPSWSQELQKQAESGDDKAQQDLGNAYEYGNGVKLDYIEAEKWYRKAAEQGDTRAWFAYSHLAGFYATGLGVKQDWEEAYFWYSLFVQTPFVQASLKSPISAGLGEIRLRADAAKHLTPKQIADVERRLREWNPLPSPSYIQMTETLKSKAERGDAAAYGGLGQNAELGFGVKPNYEEAAKWYKMGADRGEKGAQYKLGSLYLKGVGAQQDYVEAYFWLLLASKDASTDTINANVTLRDQAASHLTADQQSAVKRRAQEWKPIPASAGH